MTDATKKLSVKYLNSVWVVDDWFNLYTCKAADAGEPKTIGALCSSVKYSATFKTSGATGRAGKSEVLKMSVISNPDKYYVLLRSKCSPSSAAFDGITAHESMATLRSSSGLQTWTGALSCVLYQLAVLVFFVGSFFSFMCEMFFLDMHEILSININAFWCSQVQQSFEEPHAR